MVRDDYRAIIAARAAPHRIGQLQPNYLLSNTHLPMLTQCKHCNATVDATVHAYYDTRDVEMGVPERYTLAECPACSAPFLLSQNQWDDDNWDSPHRLYPRLDDYISWNIPKAIGAAFAEAVRCLGSKAFTASAIMCRKTLEGVCDDYGVKGRNLRERLEMLKQTGAIEGRLYQWADELRLVGNEAAHDVRIEVAAEDARDTLEFTRALLEYAYTFRHRFDAFKKRREEAAKTRQATLPDTP